MMKKLTRILSLLVVLGICLSFCGCQQLDDLRTVRVTMTEDGALRLHDGTTYRMLPECDELRPWWGDQRYYLVTEELPLLLTTMAGTSAWLSEDGKLLSYDNIYFARSDVYDDLLARIQKGFAPEVYAYSYFSYIEGKMVMYALTTAQVAAIEQILASQEPEQLPAGARLDPEYEVDLEQYSSDYLFCWEALDICYADGAYYLVTADNAIYSVPAELAPVFAELVAKAISKY